MTLKVILSLIPLRLFLDHSRFRKTQNGLEARVTLYACHSPRKHPRNVGGYIIHWTGEMNKYLLQTEFEVRTVSYGPRFFPYDIWPKREALGLFALGP